MWRACSSISCIFKGFHSLLLLAFAFVPQIEHAAHFGVKHFLRLADQRSA